MLQFIDFFGFLTQLFCSHEITLQPALPQMEETLSEAFIHCFIFNIHKRRQNHLKLFKGIIYRQYYLKI